MEEPAAARPGRASPGLGRGTPEKRNPDEEELCREAGHWRKLLQRLAASLIAETELRAKRDPSRERREPR